MNIRIKSYSTMAEALSDQAHLQANGISALLENTKDIHPAILGQVFLSVEKQDAAQAIRLLNSPLFED